MRTASPFILAAAVILIATFPACLHTPDFKTEASALLAEQTILNEKHGQLDQLTDSLWDTTTTKLAAALPSDFPAIDRDIFLTSRNAYHIRMFQSFHLLDTDAQQLVHEAAREDSLIADRLRALDLEQRQFEQKKNAFLMKIAQVDPEAQKVFAAQFREVTVNSK